MEVSTIIFWIIGVIISGFAGYFIGISLANKKHDGIIFVEPTEDEDRERIRFVLDMDLDDIRESKRIIFKVDSNASKNSQSV